jgi:uncharacterized protein (DUF934 family)
MAVVDRNGPIADAWVKLADDEPAPAGAAVVVSLARLKNEHNALFAAAARVGVEIAGDVVLEDLVALLPRLSLVIVRFAFMRDGRPFSIGRLLRERYRYQGDLRANGDFIPDQVLFLLRCGYNSFEVGAGFSTQSLKQSVAAYTAWYQRGIDRAPTVLDLRHAQVHEKPNGSTS